MGGVSFMDHCLSRFPRECIAFVSRKINGALALHQAKLEEIEQLETSFKDALRVYDQTNDVDLEEFYLFEPLVNPSGLAHDNRALSPRRLHRTQTNRDAETRLNEVLEEPVLAKQVCRRFRL